MKLEPIRQFICDTCGQVIDTPAEGWVEWLLRRDDSIAGFRIVHASFSSPRSGDGGNCQYPITESVGDISLDRLVGEDGLARLLPFFERNLGDLEELLEVARRLHIPHYEEARLYWQSAHDNEYFEGANEYWPYLQESLTTLIKKYAED